MNNRSKNKPSVLKSLAGITVLLLVSVFLLPGSVSGQSKSNKRGICGKASPEDLAILAPYVAWYYDWSVEPPAESQGELSGIEWVPMIWGAITSGDVDGIVGRIPAESKYLLGFNEPNFISQSNLTPQQAADSWPYVEEIAAAKGLKIVSPAVNWCGDCVAGVTNDPMDWLDKFFEACPGCKVDYIAIHSYAPYPEALQDYIDRFRKYKIPLWITEFAPWDPPKPDYEGVLEYMLGAIPILENDTSVFRYSWFANRVDINPDISLLAGNGVLTKVGQLYASMAFEGMTTDVPPVALAGADQFINQPDATTTLNGTAYDANDDEISIVWTQESGPNTAVFSNTAIAKPVVLSLVPGTYVFRMTVYAAGRTDYDEVSVNLGPPNIALDKPATASSSESASLPPSAANDGDMNTRWSSAFSDPQWIRIDLQDVYDLTGVRIYWESAAAKNYAVQVSTDGNAWTSVYSTTHGDGGMDNLTFSRSGRYVRIYSSARLTQYGNSIWELQIFGTLKSGIEDLVDEEAISVFPNPSDDNSVTLSLASFRPEEEVQISVHNMAGDLICTDLVRIPGDRRVEFMMPSGRNTGPGVYIITVRGKSLTRHTRLVIN
jgi:hypothetical protein